MTPEEIERFLSASKTMILCSIGKDGVPHPMPMWYGVEPEGVVVMTTFTKSQKIRNLERDPRVSLLVEAGEQYSELQGVVLYGAADLVRETPAVLDILARVTARNGGAPRADSAALRAGLEATARKRTGIRVRPTTIVSWDHRKLAGVY
jgi:PPOX class probable F420-dependent enzyme